MRTTLLVSLFAAVASAGPKKGGLVDMMHPRSPDTPLEIVYKPYWCNICAAEERIEEREKKVHMMRMPVEDLAKELDLDKGWICITTPHFFVLSTLRGSKIKFKGAPFVRADLMRLKTIFTKLGIGREGATLNAHQRAHLYHIRAERLYSHFAALTDNKKKWLGMQAPYHLLLFDDYAPHHTLVDKFIGRANDKAGVQHHDRDLPNFMAFTTAESQVSRDQGKGDAIFANHVIHSVAHNLADGHFNYHRETWAWLEEGLGHYYERLENEKHNTFCWAEGKPPQAFQKSDWESVIYNLVRRGRDDPLNRWCEKLLPGELTGTQNGMSWSIVQWLVETEPIRFTKMLQKMEDTVGKPTCEECIQHAFGVSPSVLHTRWREWVREKYAKKK